MAALAILLTDRNAIRAKAEPRADVVVLERTFYDPPRRAGMVRWTDEVRQSFPNAELVPMAWHLVSHGPEDGIRERVTRTLPGPPHLYGALQDSAETRNAWEITMQCVDACGAKRLLVRTGGTVNPGGLGRKRLRELVATRRTEELQILWEPGGLWTSEDALAFAAELGISVVLPAFEGGRPRYVDEEGALLVSPHAWLRVEGTGPRDAVGGGMIDALLDHLAEAPDATLLFTGPRALASLRSVADAML